MPIVMDGTDSIGDLGDALAAKAAYPAGGVDGNALVKSGTTTAWGSAGALVLVGKGTAAASSAVSINGCFTATYDNYLVVVDATSASTSLLLRLRMRAAGTDNSSANYGYAFSKQTFATGILVGYSSDPAGIDQGLLELSSGQGGALSIVVYSPALTVKTSFTFESVNDVNVYSGGGQMTVTTAYDGITIYTSAGTFTTPTNGIRVYGYQNA